MTSPQPFRDSAPAAARFTVSSIAGYAAAGLSAAAILLSGLKPGEEGIQAGDRVTYAEDFLGRPWRVVERHGFDRYELRCGTMKVFADQGEIRPYVPPAPSEETATLLAADDSR